MNEGIEVGLDRAMSEGIKIYVKKGQEDSCYARSRTSKSRRT
jgi:hypothetical protein